MTGPNAIAPIAMAGPGTVLMTEPEGAPKADWPALEALKEAPPMWDALIFVGTGGNYFYAKSYLEVMGREARYVAWIDPDTLEPRNAIRQWPGRQVGATKVDVAANEWPIHSDACYMQRFAGKVHEFQPSVKDKFDGILILCLPDNDKARLDTMVMADQMLKGGFGRTVAVVVAGTDLDQGQAYWGIGQDGDWIHDWRTDHASDVSDDAGRPPVACGQRPLDNFMTGACVIECLQELLDRERHTITEFWWATYKGKTLITRRPVLPQ